MEGFIECRASMGANVSRIRFLRLYLTLNQGEGLSSISEEMVASPDSICKLIDVEGLAQGRAVTPRR